MNNKYNINVVEHFPSNNSIVNSDIQIKVELSSEIKENSLNENTFIVTSKISDINVDGDLTYNSINREIIFIPNDLLEGKSYKVNIVGVESLDGEKLFYDFSFKTNYLSKIKPPRIIQPIDNSVVTEAKISWENTGDESYVLEVSKDINFNELVLSSIVYNTSIKPNIEQDKTYYTRVKVNDDHINTTKNISYDLGIEDLTCIGDSMYEIAINETIDGIVRIFDSEGDNYSIKNQELQISDNKEVYLLNRKKGIVNINIPSPWENMQFYISVNIVVEEINNDFSNLVSFYYESPVEERFDDLFEKEGLEDKSSIEFINQDEDSINYNEQNILIKIPESIEQIEDINFYLSSKDIFNYNSKQEESLNVQIDSQNDNFTILQLTVDFSPNKKYFLTINTLENNYQKEFTTNYSPYYSSFRRVLSGSIKSILTDLNKKSIEEEIHFNSLNAEDIATTADNMWDLEDIPFYVSEFVTKKTQYTLLRDNVILSSVVFDEAKIADFTLRGSSYSNVKSILDELKNEIKRLEDLLKGLTNRGNANIQSFVKGENSQPYPLDNREFRSL